MKVFEPTSDSTQDDAPDILLPQQHNELQRRCHELPGELRLMFAVLEDAIVCYLRYMNAKSRQRRRFFYEVQHWMNSRYCKGLFAFETLCEVLGIDGDKLSSMLEQQRRGLIDRGECASSEQTSFTRSSLSNIRLNKISRVPRRLHVSRM